MSTILRVALRLWPAVLLVFTLSGAPHVLMAALAIEERCAEDCDGGFGDKECPPTCTQGACAKVYATVLTSSPLESPRAELSQRRAGFAAPEPAADPRLSPPMTDVFHPPRA